jgi:hypothetical protein
MGSGEWGVEKSAEDPHSPPPTPHSLLPLLQLDLEQFRPVLARHEEAV